MSNKNSNMNKSNHKIRIVSLSLLLIYCILFQLVAYAEVLERIVAVVNDDVILLSELRRQARFLKDEGLESADEVVLDEMIDRRLLLEQAEKMKIEIDIQKEKALNADDMIINKYIERRVKAFIHIPLRDMEDYYNENKGIYGDKKFYEVKNEIEALLIETRLTEKLEQHIRELRKESNIRVQLK